MVDQVLFSGSDDEGDMEPIPPPPPDEICELVDEIERLRQVELGNGRDAIPDSTDEIREKVTTLFRLINSETAILQERAKNNIMPPCDKYFPPASDDVREKTRTAHRLIQAKYDAGMPFFTKDLFRDAVRQFESHEKERKVTVTGFDGVAVRFRIRTGEEYPYAYRESMEKRRCMM